MKHWISITETKEIVSLSRPTIVNLILNGSFRGKRVGRKWLIDEESIHEYMKGDETLIDMMVQRVLN